MTLKTKTELIAALKAKSLPAVKAPTQEEMDAAKAKEEADKKAKEEADAAAAKAKADEEAKACADKPKEEPKAKEDASAPVSLESLSAKIDDMMKNMNMVMEALSVVLEGNAPEAAPAEEEKEVTPKEEEKEVTVEVESEESEDEEEMMKELEKTVAELEALDSEE